MKIRLGLLIGFFLSYSFSSIAQEIAMEKITFPALEELTTYQVMTAFNEKHFGYHEKGIFQKTIQIDSFKMQFSHLINSLLITLKANPEALGFVQLVYSTHAFEMDKCAHIIKKIKKIHRKQDEMFSQSSPFYKYIGSCFRDPYSKELTKWNNEFKKFIQRFSRHLEQCNALIADIQEEMQEAHLQQRFSQEDMQQVLATYNNIIYINKCVLNKYRKYLL